MTTASKHYIGDAVYVEYDGYNVILTTENGVSVTNTILLEPEVWDNLVAWLAAFGERAP